MPVGTSFEHSAMKASFSLSSLQTTDISPCPEKEVKLRQYNSLTKKRVKAPSLRKSWASTASEHRDDFWSVLQANYNYIMDNQLIDKCQEANSDLGLEKRGIWSLEEFIAQYSELYCLLNSAQEMIYGTEEHISDKAIRLQCQSMVLEQSPLLNLLNDQASQLVQLHPEVQEEVTWRLNHLNSKWDTISSILGPSECGRCDQDTCLDIDHEIKCLRKWIKNMEFVLQPLDLKTKYTKTEIEAKALELKVLHRDIENHGKIVNSVVKLCKRTDASCNKINVRRIANGLERRWHLLFLSSLEWQCYLESLTLCDNSKDQTYSSDESDSDFCKEPVYKYPRLSERETNVLDTDSDSDQKRYEFTKTKKSAKSLNQQDVMNTRSSFKTVQVNGIDTVDGPLVVSEDTSHFTKSNRKGPNLATYYFKHEDTDSDMEKIQKNTSTAIEESEEQSMLGETSDEEWVFNRNMSRQGCELESSNAESSCSKSKLISEETIKRLVQNVEELVSPDKSKNIEIIHSLNKMSRVKQWLSINKPEDSCDASGEDDEKESQVSEDADESLTTSKTVHACSSQNTSFTECSSDSTPKVQMRQRKYTSSRPWSVSCILQLEPSKGMNSTITSYSNSESALHNINLTPKNIEDFNASSVQTIGVNGNNSTSSTMEDSYNILTEEKASPNRRRRLKMRRKCLNKSQINKVETNSRLFKSSSYSGQSNNPAHNERQTSSDPPAVSIYTCGKYETTSGADTDDSAFKRLPAFKIGSKTSYLSTDLRDNSPGKSSLNTAEEQSSSLSEQAWDSYQEKYLSEAYSETHDSDAARKLLEFGEDYRNFIDSQSDWSTNADISPSFPRRTVGAPNIIDQDSDSDTESFRHLMNSSREQLVYTQGIYQQQVSLGLKQYLETNDISEMLSTCDRHVDLLNHIDQIAGKCVSREDKKAATDLLDQWTHFRRGVLKMREYRNLQREILQMKQTLSTIPVPDSDSVLDLGYVNDLEKEVNKHEKLLASLKERKKVLLDLNVAVHHFVVENKEYNASSLKNDVGLLYCLWENLHAKTSSRLSQLQPWLESWKTLENRLDQLHGDLRSDEKTLLLLDSALKGGSLSEQTAVYVRDVAKLLSETNPTQGCIPELFTEGSWSDSGISDEGSEHELGERERRLAAIKRLVRQLEVVMSPDSDSRLKMADRLNGAEEELKALQKRCRTLIVRSATCTVPLVPKRLREEISAPKSKSTAPKDEGGDPGSDPGPSSWIKRALRASVPFQLVLVTILCIAWLLEPQCCDHMNNYAWSLSPQLRYINGPPPI